MQCEREHRKVLPWEYYNLLIETVPFVTLVERASCSYVHYTSPDLRRVSYQLLLFE